MRFVADNPPPSLVDKMARTFVDSDGDLRAVMEAMLRSPQFWSQGAYRSKLKSPLEMVASAVRALDAEVDFAFALSRQLVDLGQPLYRKQEPTGYTNAGEEWVNSAALLARMNFAIALAADRIPGVKVKAGRFGDAEGTDQIAKELLLTDLSDQARNAIEQGLRAKPSSETATQADTGDPAQLAMVQEDGAGKRGGSPRFRLLPPRPVSRHFVIAGLILGSPDFQKR